MCSLLEVNIDLSKSYRYNEYIVFYLTIKNMSFLRNRKLEVTSNCKFIKNFSEIVIPKSNSNSVIFGPIELKHPNASVPSPNISLKKRKTIEENFVFQNTNNNDGIEIFIKERSKIVWKKIIKCEDLEEKTDNWIINNSHT